MSSSISRTVSSPEPSPLSRWLRPILGIGFMTLALGSSPAAADQCGVVQRHIGKRVQELVAEGALIAELCEPCGETKPSWLIVRRVEVIDWEPGAVENSLVEIQVNSRAVDLAYTYFRVAETRWQNLALLVGCEATDVSPEIEFVVELPDLRKEEPPPEVLTLDITEMPYGGFEREWVAAEAITLRPEPDASSEVVQGFAAGTRVRMLQVLSTATPTRVEVVYDRRPFHRGEIFYLLHARDEEIYRIWYYGEIREEEVDGIDTFERLSDVRGCPGPWYGCWAVAEDRLGERVWARVVTESGVEGWVSSPTTWFDGVYSIPREHWPLR